MTERKRYTVHLTLTRSQHKRLLLLAKAQGVTLGEVAGEAFNTGLSTAYRRIAGGTDTHGHFWDQELPGYCAVCSLRLEDTPGTSPDGVICQGCNTIIEMEVNNASN